MSHSSGCSSYRARVQEITLKFRLNTAQCKTYFLILTMVHHRISGKKNLNSPPPQNSAFDRFSTFIGQFVSCMHTAFLSLSLGLILCHYLYFFLSVTHSRSLCPSLFLFCSLSLLLSLYLSLLLSLSFLLMLSTALSHFSVSIHLLNLSVSGFLYS